MKKNFNHEELFNALSNIKENDSIESAIDELNNEPLMGTHYSDDDPFNLDPGIIDIRSQFLKLDRNIIYDEIFDLAWDLSKGDPGTRYYRLEYGLVSSKKIDLSFLISLESRDGDLLDRVIKSYKKINEIDKKKIPSIILNHFYTSDACKYHQCDEIHLNHNYEWDLNKLYEMLNKIIKEENNSSAKSIYPKFKNRKHEISIWRTKANQKKKTFECIKFLN